MKGGDLVAIVERFSSMRILVVGDIMLDEYVWGDVQRISPEAPVPVVEIRRRTWTPGGAANTAANIVGLGGSAFLAGVVGEDDQARVLCELLNGQGVNTSSCVADSTRPTTTKTRVIAHNQQIVRMDSETRADLPKTVYHDLLVAIEKQVEQCDACILSDYNKGVLSEALSQSVIEFARRYHKPVVVDPKGTDYRIYRGATILKPNLLEAEQATRMPITSDEDVLQAGRYLMSIVEDGSLLLTRGADGMSLFLDEQTVVHIPALARNVFDVTGAGDTVVSTLALSLAAGGSLQEGAHLANRAASIVVGKMGTAIVTLDELHSLLQV